MIIITAIDFVDPSIVCFGFLTFQHANRERDHFHDVKLSPSDFAIVVVFVSKDGNICIVKLIVRWTTAIGIDKCLQCAIDTLWDIGNVSVSSTLKTLDLIRQRRDPFEG